MMAEPTATVLSYLNPQADPPPGSRISFELTETGVVVEAPGAGASRFGGDLVGHLLFALLFLFIIVSLANDFANDRERALAIFLFPLALLSVVVISFVRLTCIAIRPTRFEIRDGRLTIERPLGRVIERPVTSVKGFTPLTIGISLTLRAFGSLRLDGVDEDRVAITLLKRFYHSEVVWLARLLNDELVRQREKVS